MKNRYVAFVLSFLLPGAGLAYLGQWKGAAANLGLAFGIGVLLALILPGHVFDASIRYVAMGIGGASGQWARQKAEEMSKKANAPTTLEALADEVKLA